MCVCVCVCACVRVCNCSSRHFGLMQGAFCWLAVNVSGFFFFLVSSYLPCVCARPEISGWNAMPDCQIGGMCGCCKCEWVGVFLVWGFFCVGGFKGQVLAVLGRPWARFCVVWDEAEDEGGQGTRPGPRLGWAKGKPAAAGGDRQKPKTKNSVVVGCWARRFDGERSGGCPCRTFGNLLAASCSQ